MSFPFAEVAEMDSILDYTDYKMDLLGDDRCGEPACSYCYSENPYDPYGETEEEPFWFNQPYYKDITEDPTYYMSYQDMLDEEEEGEFEVMFSKLKKTDEHLLTAPVQISGQRAYLDSQFWNFSMSERRGGRKQTNHKNWTLRNHREG